MNDQYPRWQEIEEIHGLYESKDYVSLVLSIFEFGYVAFFANYVVFLEKSFGRRPYSDLVWDEVYGIYTSKPYCQLWQGLDEDDVPRTKYKRSRYEWFDSLRDRMVELPPPKQGINLKDIFN